MLRPQRAGRDGWKQRLEYRERRFGGRDVEVSIALVELLKCFDVTIEVKLNLQGREHASDECTLATHAQQRRIGNVVQ